MDDSGRGIMNWGWASIALWIAVLGALLAPRTEGPTAGRKMFLAVEQRFESRVAAYRALTSASHEEDPAQHDQRGPTFTESARRLTAWTRRAPIPVAPNRDSEIKTVRALLQQWRRASRTRPFAMRRSWRRARAHVEGWHWALAPLDELGETLAQMEGLVRDVEQSVRRGPGSRGSRLQDVLLPPAGFHGLRAIESTHLYLRLAALLHRVEGRRAQSLDASLRGYAFALDAAPFAGALREHVADRYAEDTVVDLEILVAEGGLAAAELTRLAEALPNLERALPEARRQARVAELRFLARLLGSTARGPTGLEFDMLDVYAWSALDRPLRAERALLDADRPDARTLQEVLEIRDLTTRPSGYTRNLAWQWVERLSLLVRLRLLATQVAVLRFEQAEGRRPDSLQALVPKWLPAAPTCVLSDTPLQFDGQRLWSYGWDGDNDEGRPFDEQMDQWDGDLVRGLPGLRLDALPQWSGAPEQAQIAAVLAETIATEPARARMDAWVRSHELQDTRPPMPPRLAVRLESLAAESPLGMVEALIRAVRDGEEGDASGFERARFLDAALRKAYRRFELRYAQWEGLAADDPGERYIETAIRWWFCVTCGWEEHERY